MSQQPSDRASTYLLKIDVIIMTYNEVIIRYLGHKIYILPLPRLSTVISNSSSQRDLCRSAACVTPNTLFEVDIGLYLLIITKSQQVNGLYKIYIHVCRLLSEVDEKTAKAPTGCDDKDFVDIIFTDLAAINKLPPSVRQAYKYVIFNIQYLQLEASSSGAPAPGHVFL